MFKFYYFTKCSFTNFILNSIYMIIGIYHWNYPTLNSTSMYGFRHYCTDTPKPNSKIEMMRPYANETCHCLIISISMFGTCVLQQIHQSGIRRSVLSVICVHKDLTYKILMLLPPSSMFVSKVLRPIFSRDLLQLEKIVLIPKKNQDCCIGCKKIYVWLFSVLIWFSSKLVLATTNQGYAIIGKWNGPFEITLKDAYISYRDRLL